MEEEQYQQYIQFYKDRWKQLSLDGLVPNIKGWPEYSVNRAGAVSCVSGGLLKPCSMESGYLRVGFCRGSVRQSFLVHRLVAIAFIPNPENKPVVNHLNGIKSDPRAENLAWATHSENIAHSFEKLGRVGHCANRILSAEQVLLIVGLDKAGLSPRMIAEQLGVMRHLIYPVLSGKNYSKIINEAQFFS